jgi:hypothetical protein
VVRGLSAFDTFAGVMDTITPRIFFPMADVSGRRSAFEITLGERGEPLDRAALGVGALPTLWRALCPGRPCPLAPEGDAVLHGVDLDPEVSMRRMGRSGQLAMALLLSGVTSRWVGVDSVWATGSIDESGRLDTALNGVDGKLERFMDWVDARPDGERHLFVAPLGRYDVVEANARVAGRATHHVFDPAAPLSPGELAAGVHVVFIPETARALTALLAEDAPGEEVSSEDVSAPRPSGRRVIAVAAALFALLAVAFAVGRGGEGGPPDRASEEAARPAAEAAPVGSPEEEPVEPAFDIERMGEAVDDLKRQRKAGVLPPDGRLDAVIAPDAGAQEQTP